MGNDRLAMTLWQWTGCMAMSGGLHVYLLLCWVFPHVWLLLCGGLGICMTLWNDRLAMTGYCMTYSLWLWPSGTDNRLVLPTRTTGSRQWPSGYDRLCSMAMTLSYNDLLATGYPALSLSPPRFGGHLLPSILLCLCPFPCPYFGRGLSAPSIRRGSICGLRPLDHPSQKTGSRPLQKTGKKENQSVGGLGWLKVRGSWLKVK